MNPMPQEGGNRPLSFSAPILPTFPAARRSDAPSLWAALASYPLAYLYVREVLCAGTFAGWGLPAFAVLFVLGVDLWAKAHHRTPAGETPLWAGCYLALSVAMPLWGAQPGGLSVWQTLVWHLFAIWYVLARCHVLAAGHSGLFFLDGLAGLFTLPWSSFLCRLRAMGRLVTDAMRRRSVPARRFLVGIGSALLAAGLCGLAGSQLVAADANFARLLSGVQRWWNDVWRNSNLPEDLLYFLLSLPVGAWLYGLVAGALRREEPPCPERRFRQLLQPLQKLPVLTADLALGALCTLYTLFFAVQALAFLAADAAGLSAPDAAGFAVDGFWELCRVLLLNFAVLAGIRLLARQTPPRWLTALFAAFGVAFALLDGAKLLTYIRLYGFTPRRVVSGWFLCVLLVWTVLALIQLFRPIPALRIAVAVLAVSFTLLSCADIESRIVRANLRRYTAGVDAELDTDVLYACGVNNYSATCAGVDGLPGRLTAKTQWLVDAGWFQGRTSAEISELYLFSYGETHPDDGVRILCATLDEGHELVLTLQDKRCTDARVEPLG